jgi:peptidoglycan/xylan/chitin deacetylase (PgdA/CDA1 family)
MAQKIACLSVDMEPDLRCPQARIRLLDDDQKLDALRSLLVREHVPLTSFVVMKHARRYADRLNALAQDASVEFAVHSYSHDQNAPASEDEVRRSWDAFGEVWNAPPHGYRSPNCLIDSRGLTNLAAQGFRYDSSITPSVRWDRYAYNNLHLPTTPFLLGGLPQPLLELPVACLAGVRAPFVFSYVKLLSLFAYRSAMALLPLPDTLVTYFHPYDLYAAEVAGNIPGWKRYAHMRGSGKAMDLLGAVVRMLKHQGYEFVLMRDLAQGVVQAGQVRTVAVGDVDRNVRRQ